MATAVMSNMSSQDSEGLPRLPDAAVLSILQHMPLQQRLRCALVCRSWAAAADLVPARVVASYCDCWIRSSAYTSHVPLREQFEAEVVDADAGELQDWLSSNSAKVSFVCLNPGCSGEAVFDGPDYYYDLRLDCRAVPQLTSLILWGVDLILEAAMCSSNNTADDSAGSGLVGCNITVTSSSNVTGSNSHSTTVTAAVLPALQQLILANCLIDTHSLKVLQKATALTSLKIAEFWGPPGGWDNTGSGSLYIPVVEDNQANTEMRKATRAELSTALVSLLQHLPLLQHLSLNISWARDEEYINPRDDTPTILDVSPALSTLQDLQHLSLSYIPSNLEGLPTSLTKLHLHGERECLPVYLAGYQLSLQTVPQLTGLTALEHLELEKYAIDPTILPWFTHLQHLVLDDAVLLVPGPDGVLQQRHDGTPVVALLEALRHLTQLQKLILEINLDQEGIGTAAQQAERLAALTASSQLTRLCINKASGMGNWWRSIILPDQGLLHLLREGRQLPHLKELHIASAGASWLDLEGAERLVKCCPALEQLDLTALADCGTPFCAVVKALLPLRATLTSLYLQDCSGRGDATAAAVAQLTGLQSLMLGGEDDGGEDDGEDDGFYIKAFQPEFTVASVEQLTALQGLTFLSLSGQLRIYKEGGSPDVWRQLQQHCQLLDPSWIMPLVCQCRMGLPRSSSPQDRDLPELPVIAVLSIMHHMPLQQRLRCTLVCHSWAKAAKLIPSRVTVSCYECQKLSFKVDHRAA